MFSTWQSFLLWNFRHNSAKRIEERLNEHIELRLFYFNYQFSLLNLTKTISLRKFHLHRRHISEFSPTIFPTVFSSFSDFQRKNKTIDDTTQRYNTNTSLYHCKSFNSLSADYPRIEIYLYDLNVSRNRVVAVIRNLSTALCETERTFAGLISRIGTVNL